MTDASSEGGSHPGREPVLTRAVVRAAGHLGLGTDALARTLGLPEAAVLRMKQEGYVLEEGTKPFELAALLIRLYRSLDAIAGGDGNMSRAWMRNFNTALGGAPIDRIATVPGLVDVLAYLDARRAGA